MLLFWRHGYEGTSIADLTGAMGVTPPTLYAAFGSKEELYREALSLYAEDEKRPIPRGLDMRGEMEAYLRACARAFSDPAKPGGCMISTGLLQCAVENKPAKDAATALRAKALSAFTSKLKFAQKTGELPADTDAAALARFYAAIVQGMSVQAFDGASTKALDNMATVAMSAWPGKHARKVEE
jgi:AcrR family transcriptional regulator